MATSTDGMPGTTTAWAGDRIDRLALAGAMATAAGLVAGAGTVSALDPAVGTWAFAGGVAAVALTWLLNGAGSTDPRPGASLPARASAPGPHRAAGPPLARDRQVVEELLALAERIRAVPAPARPAGAPSPARAVTTVGGPAGR